MTHFGSSQRIRGEGESIARDPWLRSLVEGSPDPVVLYDADLRFLAFNDAFAAEFERVFGARVARGHSLADALAHLSEERARNLELGARVLAGETLVVVREFGEEPSTRGRYEVRATPIRHEGEVVGAAVVVRDVSGQARAGADLAELNRRLEVRVAERTRELEATNARLREEMARREVGERELRAERELLRSLVQTIPVMITVYDPALDAFTLNREVERVLGWTDEDAREGRLLERIYPDPLQRAEVTAFMQRLEPGWRDLSCTAKAGDSVPCSWANIRLSDDRRVGIGLDLRARHATEQALRESEGRFRSVVEQLPVPVMVYAADAQLVLVNAAWTAATGYAAADLADHDDWLARAYPGRLAEVAGLKERLRQTDEVYEGEHDVRVRSGDRRCLLLRSVPIGRLPDGRRLRCTVAHDVTEQRRYERTLEEAARRKDDFLAVLGHELRNPLAAIRSATDILKVAAEPEPLVERVRGILDRQTAHVVSLLDGLLDVSRVSRGKIALERQPIDLRDVVREVAGDRAADALQAEVSLRLALPAHALLVDGDRSRLVQVFDNLLTNALKFTPAGGRVVVSAEREEDAVVAAVADTGVGLDPASQDLVFEPFQQVAGPLDRSGDGLGLGLPLARGLVRLHGGDLTVRSEGLGAGAEFRVVLPAASAALPEQRSTGPAGAPGSRRVLVVDDNVDGAEALREVLERLGHQVTTAPDGTTALDLAPTLRPDLVLCDIGLPGGLDGHEVGRRLRADPALAGTRLVALTGYGRPEDRERALAAGFDDHQAKPVSLEALGELLATAPAPPVE